MKRILITAAFAATVPLANWLIGNVGTVCPPDSPCLIPVWPGLMAPSGVLAAGLALVLRDAVHEAAGAAWAAAAILLGALVSLFVGAPGLAVASATAFFLSELIDLAVYSPLRRRNMALAVIASGIAGAAVDSAAFLLLAFGSLDFLAGQVIGKLYASAAVALYLWVRYSGRKVA